MIVAVIVVLVRVVQVAVVQVVGVSIVLDRNVPAVLVMLAMDGMLGLSHVAPFRKAVGEAAARLERPGAKQLVTRTILSSAWIGATGS